MEELKACVFRGMPVNGELTGMKRLDLKSEDCIIQGRFSDVHKDWSCEGPTRKTCRHVSTNGLQ